MATKKKTTSKKKTSKKKAVAVRKNTAITSWQSELDKVAKAGKTPKEKALSSEFISIKGSKFTLNGVKIGLDGKGLELDCVIVGWCFEKSFYDSDFVEGEKSAPACFALGYDEEELEHHETSPNPQCDGLCSECELNEWGSGKGDGKACADRRRLVLAVEGKDGAVETKLLNIPPTSLKNWKSFVNDLEHLGLHPMQCAVNIHFDEDSTAPNPPLVFELVNEITKESTLQALAATLEHATKMLEQPYDVSNYKPSSKRGRSGKKGTTKKKASKKKTATRRSKFS